MATRFTLLFQGQVETVAGPAASTEEVREVAHAAFPMTPPRSAATDPGFRAWKIAPLTSGRLLLSTVLNRGDQDEYGRPVLRAEGCLLNASEMTGAWRDPAAIWQALEVEERSTDLEALTRRIEALSIHSAPEAYALFQSELERAGDFHARVAAVLLEETADLYLGDVASALDRLRPSLGLLPLERLGQLHLAIGAEASDAREPLLGLAGGAPDSWRENSLLGSLFGRKKEGQSEAAADFETYEVFGTRASGPSSLAEAIANPSPWPLGLEGQDRYRVLLSCIDADRTLFDAVPELDALRLALQRLETLSKDLGRWR